MRVASAAAANWQPGPPGRLAGHARVRMFELPPGETDLTAMTVEFTDGGRAAWHSHPRGQILIAVSGLGLVQAAGGEVVELRPGDSVWAPPGERHWHGAAPGQDFSYTCVQAADPDTGSATDW